MSEELAKCERLKILRLESNCLSLDDFPARLLSDSPVSLLALDGNVFEVKQLTELEGYDKVSPRQTPPPPGGDPAPPVPPPPRRQWRTQDFLQEGPRA